MLRRAFESGRAQQHLISQGQRLLLVGYGLRVSVSRSRFTALSSCLCKCPTSRARMPRAEAPVLLHPSKRASCACGIDANMSCLSVDADVCASSLQTCALAPASASLFLCPILAAIRSSFTRAVPFEEDRCSLRLRNRIGLLSRFFQHKPACVAPA